MLKVTYLFWLVEISKMFSTSVIHVSVKKTSLGRSKNGSFCQPHP